MCGIVALSRSQPGPEVAALVDDATRAMTRRGPDDAGVTATPDAAVGMCRLRVRSSRHDRVPFTGDDADAYAFNGEVYGVRVDGIRRQVPGGIEEARAVAATSVTGARGPEADGMWALAHLHPGGEIDLHRDPWGIKPLWIRTLPGEAAACSELPTLLRATAHRHPRIRPEAVAQLLLCGSVVDGGSYWDDVAPVVPGAQVHLRRGAVQVLPGTVGTNDPGCAGSVADALGSSVEAVLDADRPVGLALSGGLDSTAIALHTQEAGLEDLATVSVCADGSLDGVTDLTELGLPPGAHHTWRHHHVRVGPRDVLDLLRDVTEAWGAPTALTSAPLYLSLARAAGEAGIVVLVTGEGADELFGGYRSYLRIGRDLAPIEFYADRHRRELVANLVHPHDRHRAETALACRLGPGRGPDAVRAHERALSLGPLLERTDAATMANSIEARTPFLHGDVPAVADQLPWEHLVGGNQTKRALRDAYSSQLPWFAKEIKKPFRAPWSRWIAGDLGDEVRALLAGSADRLSETGIRTDGVRTVLDAAVDGDETAASLTFTLCSLAFWLEGRAAAEAAAVG